MANFVFTWVKNYLGEKFYTYTHTDAVYVGDTNSKNLTTVLNEMNTKIIKMQEIEDIHVHDNMEVLDLITDETLEEIKSSYEHISDENKHIPSGGADGQIIGKKDGKIGWVDRNDLLDEKVDKELGKGLSENNYTTNDKDKVTKLNFSRLVSECEISGYTITFKDIDGNTIKTFDIPQPTFSIVDGELFVSY